MKSVTSKLFDQFINIDILAKGRIQNNFIGRPFYIDYHKILLMTCDAWKAKANGIPQGTFLLAFYDGEPNVEEAILLRAIRPTKLPTDDDNIKSMIAYYKDNMDIAGRAGAENVNSHLDQFTRYEFGMSGLECSVLGVFYRTSKKDNDGNSQEKTEFGADLENFYSANNYKVYKATGEVLQKIVNQRDNENTIAGNETEFRIGNVRYSSSRRFQNGIEDVPVFISPSDFLGKRTALFGMTRTGKSNSVKKIIEATVEISKKAKSNLVIDDKKEKVDTNTFSNDGSPKYPVGQIIFDINGEYANANQQDKGSAIFEMYKDQVIRYAVHPKEGFEVMKVNFFTDILSGFSLIKDYFGESKSVDYLNNFLTIDIEEPEVPAIERSSSGEYKRWERVKAAYLCCLYEAGFIPFQNKITFAGNATLNKMVRDDSKINPSNGITFSEAVTWFKAVWAKYDDPFFDKYKKDNGHEWADEDLKACLVMLTRKKSAKAQPSLSGFRKLKSPEILDLHSSESKTSFERKIYNHLRTGKIIIVDLSQGNDKIKQTYSSRICRYIFEGSMDRFVKNKPNNFLQFYFEEAHNLFPLKENKDLSDIYNRIAKEGAKLNLGMFYATQEVSSISSNILKNTQNWFIAHLNNEDELKELRKYYDFSDFTDSLIRFSATNDKGFVRMKTYTNPFVVPVQIDIFLANK